jgi:glycosyltransferase involved in cell wall biosynthesis
MKPEASVIVTVHKRVGFLRQALESAVAQTFRAREIIVADDSGSAAASTVCEPLVTAGYIRYRANPRTLGIAGSLRAAIADTEGEFISILNDDDLWEPNFLSQLVPPLQNDNKRVLTFSDHWIISEDGSIDYNETDANTRRYGRSSLPEGDLSDSEHFVLGHNGVPLAMAAVFRKKTLDLSLLTDEVSGAYDLWIACILAASKGNFYYVPRRLTRYRVHSQSETGRRHIGRFENQVYIFSQLLERNWFPKMNDFLRATLAGIFFMLGRDKLHFDRPRDARSCFFQSIRTRPNWRAAIAILLSYVPYRIRKCLGISSTSQDGTLGTNPL